jgi:hypothetical protein
MNHRYNVLAAEVRKAYLRSWQPKADAVCVTCGHPGAAHIALAGAEPVCRCGCEKWIAAPDRSAVVG